MSTSARRLARVLGLEARFVRDARELATQHAALLPLTDEQRADYVDAFRDAWVDGRGAYLDFLAELMTAHFTTDELEEISRFYQTPAGARIAAREVDVVIATAQCCERLIQTVLHDALTPDE